MFRFLSILSLTIVLTVLMIALVACDPSGKPKPRGQEAPDFTLKDLAGNSVQLASLRGKGVVLSFWFLG